MGCRHKILIKKLVKIIKNIWDKKKNVKNMFKIRLLYLLENMKIVIKYEIQIKKLLRCYTIIKKKNRKRKIENKKKILIYDVIHIIFNIFYYYII